MGVNPFRLSVRVILWWEDICFIIFRKVTRNNKTSTVLIRRLLLNQENCVEKIDKRKLKQNIYRIFLLTGIYFV